MVRQRADVYDSQPFEKGITKIRFVSECVFKTHHSIECAVQMLLVAIVSSSQNNVHKMCGFLVFDAEIESKKDEKTL